MSPRPDADEPDWDALGLIGTCEAMRTVKDLVIKFACSPEPLLITGPPGTGKENVASACHHLSHRRNGPFVCAQISGFSETLVESELFGHVTGAFSGAERNRVGRLEEVADGTLFLDEIGTLSLAVQVKLLRVLQEKAFQRVGENQQRTLSARVISATNEDLQRAIAEERFRKDLYARFAVLRIALPPLALRGGDIELLADSFLRESARKEGKRLRRLTEHALAKLRSHEWPGNVRELQSVIAQATAMADGRETDLTQDLIEFDEVLLGSAGKPAEAGSSATATEVIAQIVVDDLLKGVVPLNGLQPRARELGPLVDSLVNGIAEGLRLFLDTGPGEQLLRNQGRREVLARLGLAKRQGGNEREFFMRVRAAAKQVVDNAS